MRRVSFYLVLAASVLMAAGFPAAIFSGENSMNLAGALAGLAGFLFVGYLSDRIVGMKNQGQLKMLLNSSRNLIETLIVAGLMLSPAVPKILAVPLLASVIFAKILEREVEDYLNTDMDPKFGQEYRIYICLLAAGLALLNTYYTFLGGLLLLGVTVYDVFSILYRLYRERDSAKLKNRILSH